jgi:hypothetical protein
MVGQKVRTTLVMNRDTMFILYDQISSTFFVYNKCVFQVIILEIRGIGLVEESMLVTTSLLSV